MEACKARIFDIQRNSFVDGPGIRTTVFFKGCNLRCKWCHNPESWTAETQMLFYTPRCVGCGKCFRNCPQDAIGENLLRDEKKCTLCGRCVFVCPREARKICGEDMEIRELVKTISRDLPFYETSGGGVTFSGGECMLQIDALHALLIACKELGIHRAVDTAANVDFSYFQRIDPVTDLYLCDIKCIDTEKHKAFTAAGNERILSNIAALLKRNPEKVWIRIPVIPGFNAQDKDMEQIRDYLKDLPEPGRIELLAYHRLGEGKRDALGYDEHFTPEIPEKKDMQRFEEIVKSRCCV